MAGSVEGLPTIEFSAWLTRDSNIDGAICDGGGRGVPARDWGDADLFDAVPEDGLRCPGGGVPFSDLAAEWLFADPLGESNRLFFLAGWPEFFTRFRLLITSVFRLMGRALP